ncbi:Glyoxalase/Bleomycin resistance protein/Dihydroxybiphenyl dioxygenase [Neohortaea acidophila]|uniref:Glyoxalase/Bleomycin resistance protein/Dihydroxybiphenyl dioxygenase n=1 Tax=Neohortaea acidophila TaxID=245834 RepID=A0A6A6PWZ9_9PEZI|nr:Glyoxalase/Bleomycin resistance protein/Dihydroxybiphenyl dioxygenase [Neohortaea acidophila]KAF2483797.1 Glyoxalase/Bleomycin resistance protein/Dihydroxybiphenyl dioxygenase [Neohortaea acidophila]
MAGTAERVPPHGNSSQFGTERPTTFAAHQPHGDVKPNAGFSLPDRDAEERGETGEGIAEWQRRNGIDPSAHIRIVKIAHMRYQHAELVKITQFLKDFGMHIVKETEDRVWWGGYGTDPYVYYCQKGATKEFLGAAFEVESYKDLGKAAKLPGASQIEEMTDAPGGGYIVTVKDGNGFPVNLIHGQQPVARGEVPGKIIQNYEVDKPRVRRFQRFTPGPAAVHKLGHFGYTVRDFKAQLDFYTRTFNLVPTDFLSAPTEDGKRGEEVVVFLHVDRGEEPVDHHTVFFGAGKTSHVHHASFEVHDFDTQQLGHQWLAKQNYTPVWGVGRHILGSQVFDYWADTSGNMIEHYADGDLVNQDTPIGWGSAADEALAVWGPELPKWFLD